MPIEWTEQISIDSLIRTNANEFHCTGPVKESIITQAAQTLCVRFPSSYGSFLAKYGSLENGSLIIFGLGNDDDYGQSIIQATLMLRNTCPDFPTDLIPIEELDDAWYACIRCNTNSSNENTPEVVRWNLLTGMTDENPLGLDFWKYLLNRLKEKRHREIGFKTMEEHVKKFEEDYLSIDKLPRNHVWRPYRFCSQDVVLGLTVVRHSVDNNSLEVDVCMTSDIPEFEEGNGAKVMVSFLLSEAYKCGGSMEIRFSDNVESHHVPHTICELARQYDVILEHISEGLITPYEAKKLYVAITEFSPKLRDIIEELANAGNLSRERACYVVHHGLWTRSELEQLILGSNRVDKLLGGESQPEQRLLYQNDILYARTAIMGGFLDRKLAKKERSDGIVAIDLEDDVRPIEISFDPTLFAKLYSCTETLPIPWIFPNESEANCVNLGQNFLVFLRARDTEDLTVNLLNDFSLISNVKSSFGLQDEGYIIGCLVPRDFQELQPDTQKTLFSYAQSQGINILVCPESSVSLDTEANRRMVSSRIMRE